MPKTPKQGLEKENKKMGYTYTRKIELPDLS